VSSYFKVMGEKDCCRFNLMLSGFFFPFLFLAELHSRLDDADRWGELFNSCCSRNSPLYFSFPTKAAVPTTKMSFAPWFLLALAHPAGTGANACCTESVVSTPKKQLSCAWPLYHTQKRVDVFLSCFPLPLFTRSVGNSWCRFWGVSVYFRRTGCADPSESNEASSWFLMYWVCSAAPCLLFSMLILPLSFLNEQIRLALAGHAMDALALPNFWFLWDFDPQCGHSQAAEKDLLASLGLNSWQHHSKQHPIFRLIKVMLQLSFHLKSRCSA